VVLRLVSIVIGGAVLMWLADSAALAAVSHPTDSTWMSLIAQLVTISAFGVISGHIAGRKALYVIALGPFLYYGTMSLLMSTPMFLWLDLRMPLTIVASLASAFTGALLPRSR